MNKKEKLQAKYEKMLLEFNEGHSKLKHLKQEMVKVRAQILSTPKDFDDRPDVWQMKEQ